MFGVTVFLPTTSVPLPAEESPGTDGLEACAVKPVEPGGVAVVVVMVSVEVLTVSVLLKLTVLGLNEPLAPVGRAVVRLRFAEKGVPVAPLRLTVTVYVELAAVPYVSVPVCGPTVTVPTLGATMFNGEFAEWTVPEQS